MASPSPSSQRKPGAEKLGRSPITGHFVLKPASEKGRSVSTEAIRNAVQSTMSRKG